MKRVSRKKAWGVLVVILVIAVGFYVLLDRFASPNELPVDTIVVPRDYATLSDALAAVGPNATIALQGGEGPYIGPYVIAVQGLRLMSTEGMATVTGGVDAAVLSIEADGVVVENIAIRDGSVGICVTGSSCRVEDVSIDSVTVGIELSGAGEGMYRTIAITADGIGVSARSGVGNTFTDITIDGGETGMLFEDCTSNETSNTVVQEADVGISIQDSIGNDVSACRIEGASIVGVEVVGGEANHLVGLGVIGGHTGVLFEGGAQSKLIKSSVLDVEQTGVLLQETAQARVEGCAIRRSAKDGILLTDSDECVLIGNIVDGCEGTGVAARSSNRLLCLRNDVRSSGIGIDMRTSDGGRLLRNTLTDNQEAAVLLYQASAHMILDNETSASPFGILLVESSDATLMRNTLSEHGSVALALCIGSDRAWISDNDIEKGRIGVLLLQTARVVLSANRLAENAEGVRLVDSEYGIRIEGNAFVRNTIGLHNADVIGGTEAILAEIGVVPVLSDGDAFNPQVAYNVFRDNMQLDVSNSLEQLLYLEANLWGADATSDPMEAVVSSGVIVPPAAVSSTDIAIGTSTDTADVVVGRVLQHALLGQGIGVVDLVGLGSMDLAADALATGDVQLIVWLDGTSMEAQTPSSEYRWISVPAAREWVVVVSSRVAEQLSTTSVSALSSSIRRSNDVLSIAVPRSVGDEAPEVFLDAVGLDSSSVIWTETETSEEAELLLKFGQVDAAVVDNITETVTLSGFVRLSDERTSFDASTLGLLYEMSVVDQLTVVRAFLEKLALYLTTDTVRGLVSRVRLLHREPGDVALEFLIDEGILAQ